MACDTVAQKIKIKNSYKFYLLFSKSLIPHITKCLKKLFGIIAFIFFTISSVYECLFSVYNFFPSTVDKKLLCKISPAVIPNKSNDKKETKKIATNKMTIFIFYSILNR